MTLLPQKNESLSPSLGLPYPIISDSSRVSPAPAYPLFDYEVSVLILTLNEGENIEIVVREVREQLLKTEAKFEIIVVDGGSTDRTVKLAAAAGARVLIQERPGYSEALVLGLRSVRGKYLITLDGDLSHPPTLIPELLAHRQTAEVVIGSRWIPGGSFEGPYYRKLLSIALNKFFQRAVALPIKDISSGYRLYHSKVLSPDSYAAKDFSILEEILVRAHVDGFSFKEVPLEFKNRNGGASHVRLFQFSFSFLKTLWRMWLLRKDDNEDCDAKSSRFRVEHA